MPLLSIVFVMDFELIVLKLLCSDSYWIGLSTQTTDTNLRMQTTTCVPGWTNWASPSYNAGGKCVIGNSALDHHWEMTSCNELHSFLCDYQLGTVLYFVIYIAPITAVALKVQDPKSRKRF